MSVKTSGKLVQVLLISFFLLKLGELAVSIIVPYFIPYLGFFSYGNTMLKYNLPYFLRSLANFDGIFYIRIALQGYSQTEQAYFPLYPLLIRFFNTLFGNNPIITGVMISLVCFAIGLLLFYKYLRSLNIEAKQIAWIFFLLFAFPTAYYFGVMYTESLFFLLLICSLYFFKVNNYPMTFICGFLIALTRVNGILILVPLSVLVVADLFKNTRKPLRIRFPVNLKNMTLLLSPFLGMASYCYYLWRTTGNPFYFISAQEQFGAHRSSKLILLPQVIYRYGKILLTASKNFQYWVAVMELSFFLLVLLLLILDLIKLIKKKNKLNYDRLGLNLFSFANLLLPTFTGTLTAIPRYSLMSISIFFFLSEMKNLKLKYLLMLVFILLHITLFGLFIQGYYVT